MAFCRYFWRFEIARKYFGDPWAFLATVGIWMASSLPIYMYFNPSWSHALSAFTVALFLWYWERTRLQRTAGQWAILGLMAGLMGNVYYPNVILLIFPALEVVHLLLAKQRDSGRAHVPIQKLALSCGVFLVAFFASLFPTFITRQIIYGSPFETGYPAISTWNWTSPALLKVLFSSDHGMFSWTPILILAVVGLAFLVKRDALLGAGSSPYLPGLLLLYCQLSGLGRHFQLRKSFFCFSDAHFHSWPRRPAQFVFELAGQDDARSCGRMPGPGLAHCLERRIYLSMGHSYGSGARRDFLERDGSQPSRRSSPANDAEPGNLLHAPRRNDAAY